MGIRKSAMETIKKHYKANEQTIFIFGIYKKEMTLEELADQYVKEFNDNEWDEGTTVADIILTDDMVSIKCDE